MTCWDRSHPPCSYCWDGAQSQSPPRWCDPSTWVWWRGWWCSVVGYGAPSWYYAPPRLTCPDVLDGCAAGAPLTWCQQNDPSARCRPGRTHRECCILLVSLVPGHPWPAEGNQIVSQKMILFITTAVKTSNPTNLTFIYIRYHVYNSIWISFKHHIQIQYKHDLLRVTAVNTVLWNYMSFVTKHKY
jgi:hypothetical protein